MLGQPGVEHTPDRRRPREWADVPMPEDGMTGLAAAVVARRHRPQRVSVCGDLVDTFCLGVKNTLGPELPRVVVGAGHVGRYAAAEPRSPAAARS